MDQGGRTLAKNLFISYSRNDADTVGTLVADASSLGYDAWLDRELSGGQQWWSEVLRRIRDCEVFVVAMSRDALNSQACESEYNYAAALGKPILPVLVKDDVSDSLLPPALAGIQRVDYTGLDKVALSALVRGLSSVPDAPALPEPLPPEPEVPATYLFDLKEEIDGTTELTSAKQEEILRQLRERLDEGHEPAALLQLLDMMGRRADLLVRTAQGIEELRARVPGASRAPTPAAAPPQPEPEPVATAPTMPEPPPQTASFAATAPAPAPAAQEAADVNGAWWIAPILFGIIGGVIAWAVNRTIDSDTARNMLITGVVANIVWLALAGGF
jgi:hypothetical protein